jgi:glycosyltransferase involved in cell wall biosynthesis
VAYAAGAHGEHVTAVLVPDGDSEQLFSKALELVQNSAKRAELGWQARSRAQLFSWDHTTAEFHDVLREVAR